MAGDSSRLGISIRRRQLAAATARPLPKPDEPQAKDAGATALACWDLPSARTSSGSASIEVAGIRVRNECPARDIRGQVNLVSNRREDSVSDREGQHVAPR